MNDISVLSPSKLIPALYSPAGNRLGECATYDRASDSLYWVDILGCQIHKADDAGHQVIPMPIQPGFVGVLESGDLIIGGGQQLLLHADGTNHIQSIPDSDLGIAINDGVVSPDGRCLIFGSRDEKEENPLGRMVIITATDVAIYPRKFAVFNGPAFSPCGRFIYFTDSPTGNIWRADFNSNNGTVGEHTLFAKAPAKEGYPDGMCTDDEGCLWSAHWDGSRLTRYRVDGHVDTIIPLPVIRPTSVVFGGLSRNTLYITSAMPDDQQQRSNGNDITNGDVLSIDMPVTGPASARLLFNPLETLKNGNIIRVE